MPMNEGTLLQRFKEKHLEADQTIDGQTARLPIPEKLMEWEMFNVMEELRSINRNLARIAGHLESQSGPEIVEAKRA